MHDDTLGAVTRAAKAAAAVTATAESMWLHATRRLRSLYRQQHTFLRAWLDAMVGWRELPTAAGAAIPPAGPTDEGWPHATAPGAEALLAPSSQPALMALVAMATVVAATHGDECHVVRVAVPVLLRSLRCAPLAGPVSALPASAEVLLRHRYRALLAPTDALAYSAGVGDTWPQPTVTTALASDLFAVRTRTSVAAAKMEPPRRAPVPLAPGRGG